MLNRQLKKHSMESQLIEVLNIKMGRIQYALIANWIQMKLMEVLSIGKSTTIQECQHSLELQLIDGMKMTILIRFNSGESEIGLE
jgi:hypothetical protein